MNIKRYILIVIIIAGIAGSFADYYFAKHDSYDKYVSGEYYFIYNADTYVPGDPNYMPTPDDPMFYADYSNPRNLLMISSQSVWVYNPHDYYCTVIYGEDEITDFPLGHIRIADELSPYFYGRKHFTYEEYIDLVGSIQKDSQTMRLGVKAMKNYKSILPYTILMCFFDVLLLVVIAITRNMFFSRDITDVVLFVMAVYSILFNVITYSVY